MAIFQNHPPGKVALGTILLGASVAIASHQFMKVRAIRSILFGSAISISVGCFYSKRRAVANQGSFRVIAATPISFEVWKEARKKRGIKDEETQKMDLESRFTHECEAAYQAFADLEWDAIFMWRPLPIQEIGKALTIKGYTLCSNRALAIALKKSRFTTIQSDLNTLSTPIVAALDSTTNQPIAFIMADSKDQSALREGTNQLTRLKNYPWIGGVQGDPPQLSIGGAGSIHRFTEPAPTNEVRGIGLKVTDLVQMTTAKFGQA